VLELEELLVEPLEVDLLVWEVLVLVEVQV